MTASGIPVIDVEPLFGASSGARDAADDAIMEAAAGTGFFVARGLPDDVPTGDAARAELLRVFGLPPGELRKLWRRKFAPSHANVYRGWFPLQRGHLTAKEGMDLGPDVAHADYVAYAGDPLCEPTPLPPPDALPGWGGAVRDYYLGMERASAALMRGIARGLKLPADTFEELFHHGLSTLRLIRYPVRTDLEEAARQQPGLWVTHDGRRCHVTGTPHVDSGFLTLLAQDGVPGLQAYHLSGHWLDVPPIERTLVVNFGKVLERLSKGRIKATLHRVIGANVERRSIPFFYEARVDARIAPLPVDDPASFEPFLYGDHLWATTTQFVEFRGMEALRAPSAAAAKAVKAS